MSMRRALAFSYAEKYGSYLLGMASTMIVSRLLGPADIGVFAVGMALVGIVAVIREFGVSTYLIQEADLSEERIRAAFTLTVGVGIGLAVVVALLSYPAGIFYADSKVTSVIAILALNFALTPFGSVSQALLTREMRFGTLTWIRLLQSLMLAVGAVGLAAAGLGPQSLAWAAVLATSVNGVVSMIVRPHAMRLTLSRPDLARVFAVGGPATAINIIDDLVTSMPELVLGRLQGLAAAGLFSRARGLSQMAHQLLARAAGPVFLAVFAERQREGEPLAPLYAKATACVIGIGWPALAMLGVLAEPVVRVLFGSDWLAVVPLLRWLSVVAAISLLTSGAHHLLLASGGARDVMVAKLVALPVHALCLLVGANFGVVWIAIAMVLSTGFASALLALAIRRRLGIGLRAQLAPAILSAPLTLASAAGSALALLIPLPGSSVHALVPLFAGGVAGAALALAALWAGSHPLRGEFARAAGQLLRSR